MAEFPALNFYTDAYLGDTAHLSIAEAGAYTNLLFVAWRIEDGGLPDDDVILARYARASRAEWRRVKSAVMAYFTLCNDGKFRQKRLELERNNAREKSAKAATAARVMWLERNKKRQAGAYADAKHTHMPGGCLDAATTSTSTSTTPFGGDARARENGQAKTISSDWQPTPDDRAWAKIAKPDLDAADLRRETQAFILHAAETRRTTFDCGASWRRWIMKASHANPAGRAKPASSLGSVPG